MTAREAAEECGARGERYAMSAFVITYYYRCRQTRTVSLPRKMLGKWHLKNKNTSVCPEDHLSHHGGVSSLPRRDRGLKKRKSGFLKRV